MRQTRNSWRAEPAASRSRLGPGSLCRRVDVLNGGAVALVYLQSAAPLTGKARGRQIQTSGIARRIFRLISARPA